MNNIIQGSGFHHIAFRTPDWDAAIRFWCDGLGFTPKLEWGEAPQRAAMLDLGDGNYLELFEREATGNNDTGERESAAMHFALRVNDCQSALQHARDAGAQVTLETTEVNFNGKVAPPAKIAFVKAPGGMIVEFFQSDAL
jgi:glyoxylase I family protein